MEITTEQERVFRSLEHSAEQQSRKARAAARKHLKSAGLTDRDIERLRNHIRTAELTINVPVRKDLPERSRRIIDELLNGPATHFQNAWQTGLSGAPVDAMSVNDDRDRFETKRLRYKTFSGSGSGSVEERRRQAKDRPRYGAANLYHRTAGAAAVTYGASALVLRPQVAARSTLTCFDSKASDQGSISIGTFEHINHLLRQYHDSLVPKKRPSQTGAWNIWCENLMDAARGRKSHLPPSYWEVQIHGVIDFREDVFFLRAGFKELFGTRIGDKVRAWARHHGWPLIWGHRSRVIVDPTVRPAEPDPEDGDRRWPHLRLSPRMASAAERVLASRWSELGPVEEHARAASFAGLWNEMPFQLRAEPAMRLDREKLETTLRDLTLRFAGD